MEKEILTQKDFARDAAEQYGTSFEHEMGRLYYLAAFINRQVGRGRIFRIWGFGKFYLRRLPERQVHAPGSAIRIIARRKEVIRFTHSYQKPPPTAPSPAPVHSVLPE